MLLSLGIDNCVTLVASDLFVFFMLKGFLNGQRYFEVLQIIQSARQEGNAEPNTRD
jgi:hypothetical protein